MRPCFLPSGNLKAKEVEEADDENAEKKETAEVTVERLMKLEADKPNWKLNISGLNEVHKIDGKDISYGINVVKSMRWPGAITINYKNTFHNFYLGWMLKSKTQPF